MKEAVKIKQEVLLLVSEGDQNKRRRIIEVSFFKTVRQQIAKAEHSFVLLFLTHINNYTARLKRYNILEIKMCQCFWRMCQWPG